MWEERLAKLEQRLAETERELSQVREQLRSAGQGKPRGMSPGQALFALGLVAILGALGLVAGARIEAGPDAKTHTVKAPFVVVDSGGKTIMRVAEDGQTVNAPFSVVDKAGKVMMDVGAEG